MEVNNASSMNEGLENIMTELRSLSSSVAMSSSVNPCEAQPTVCGKPIGVYFSELADRIEEAWKREEKAIATENAVLPAVCITKPSGNSAAMRAAMNVVHKIAATAKSDFDVFSGIERIRRISMSALAAPPRNCEVGTASERYRRFLIYCKKNTGGCDRADRHSNPCAYCFSQWEQMPYEDGAKEGGE